MTAKQDLIVPVLFILALGVEKHSVAELESFMRKDEVSCYKDYCNCPVVDCRPKNIFWFGS